jgi:hypothetical protein
MTPTSITQVASELSRLGAPVLFPDTCSLVDIIRLPYRLKDTSRLERHLQAASRVRVAAGQKPAGVQIVILPPVSIEWAEHSNATVGELRVLLKDTDGFSDRLHASAKILGNALRSPVDFQHSLIDQDLLALSSDIRTSGTVVARDSDCTDKASTREITKTAPAVKGGAHKDCLIVEHALQICREIRAAGSTIPCVFLTSNTSEFCAVGTKNLLASPLDTEFASVSLTFTSTWEWAARELGL